jgi:hypothetical protein
LRAQFLLLRGRGSRQQTIFLVGHYNGSNRRKLYNRSNPSSDTKSPLKLEKLSKEACTFELHLKREKWSQLEQMIIFSEETMFTINQDDDSEKKALEVLKVIRKLGYMVILQKDSSHSPHANLESATSNSTETAVTCQVCKKFTGRPSELKWACNLPESCLACNIR